MESMTTFDSIKESLLNLLQSFKQGKTQLPDFQRGWVWDDHHIRDLLASISLSFPIGAVMMLQTRNPDVRALVSAHSDVWNRNQAELPASVLRPENRDLFHPVPTARGAKS